MNSETKEAAAQWMAEMRVTKDSEMLEKMVARAQQIHEKQGGYIGPSHFERDGELTVEEYRRMRAATIAAKYQHDPSFKAQVDSLISRGLI